MREFTAGRFALPLGNHTYIMGILNVTPDSFSDGGRFFSSDLAVAHALEMQAQGADLIDVGGQSTRPGYEAIPWEQEWERLEPVLLGLQGKLSVPLSVDTFYPEVAKKALACGADIINDVTGFCLEEMWRTAAESSCGCIVMHPCGAPGDIVPAVHAFFEQKRKEAERFGIAPERLCMDPGVGFGKEYEQNLRLIANVGRTRLPDCAFLMAASRKRVIGQPCGNPPFAERMPGTIAAHTLAAAGGADILRVHDVWEAVQAARVADAVLSQRQG